MLRRFDASGTPALEHLAEIDRERAFEWRDIHPFAVTAARLQAADPVLRQQGQEAAVDVWRAAHVVALTFMHHPHARIRRGSLLYIGARRITDEAQGRESSVERLVKERLRQMQAARDGVHQRLTGLDHAPIVIRGRFAPTRQRVLSGQRRSLLQGVIGAYDRWSVRDVRAHVDAFLAGQKSHLQWKPSPVDIGVRRIEFLAPQGVG